MPGGALLLGVDLIKHPDTLHAAYNDAQGVTAAFNLNLLERANRELGANFKLHQFAHSAFYNAAFATRRNAFDEHMSPIGACGRCTFYF